MKYLKLTTIEEYNALNDAISTSRGYPNNLTGTERYAPDDPEPVNITDDNGNVMESYYQMELTNDIFQIVALMAGKPLIIDDTETIIPNGYMNP